MSHHAAFLRSFVPSFLCSAAVALLMMTATACDTETEVQHDDVGRACVGGEIAQPGEVVVDFGLCLSSSCDELVEASCVTSVEGSTITVEGTAIIRSKTGRNVSCTADCGLVATTCDLPELAPGTYTLIYGGESSELVIPEVDDAEESVCTVAM